MKKRDRFLKETIQGNLGNETLPEEKPGKAPSLKEALQAKYDASKDDRFTHPLTARIPIPLYKKVDEKAKELGVTVSELVRDIVNHGISQL